MNKISQKTPDKFAHSRGVTAFELIIVLVIIGLLAAFAIPQLLGARRMIKFTNIQQQLSASLRDARQSAMTQRRRITLQYDDSTKRITTYEEPIFPVPVPAPVDVFGPLGDSRNKTVTFTDNGLQAGDIIYGAPTTVPLAQMTLGDTSPFTCPSSWTPPASPSANTCPGSVIRITFNPRGDVISTTTGAVDNNKALFFYENNSKTTFAVSILAPGGRIKIWRYNGTIYQ